MGSNTDDDLCKDALEKYELLNDGQDYLFTDIDIEMRPHSVSSGAAWSSHVPSKKWHETKKPIELKGCSDAAKNHLNQVFKSKTLARSIAENIFFSLEQWPGYMVDMFVLKHVGQYSYSDRNKICLFFYGNGAQIETMFTLSELLAPHARLLSYEDKQQHEQSRQKCEGLFQTYSKERFNPNYTERYYYYSLMERRMLYLDHKPRHFGKRQEDPRMDRVGLSFGSKNKT